MCTIFFAFNYFENYPFVYLGNRDEFHKRATERARFHGNILMGQDLEKLGTWFAVRKDGRIAFLTNYRDMINISKEAISRGQLILDYLRNNKSALDYLEALKSYSHKFNDFNLILGDMNQLYYFSSVQNSYRKLKPGLYGLSNGLLDESWYKVDLGKDLVKASHVDVESYFHILDNNNLADDDKLPSTGLNFEAEKALSALHVDYGEYGTVYKQVVLYDGRKIAYYDKTIIDNFNNIKNYTFELEGVYD
jgi:uncharacterized protein with NRDE domain